MKRVVRTLYRSTLLSALWLMALSAFAPVAHAASPVSYIVSPTSGSVQPNSTVDLELSFKTDVDLAGGNVHLEFTSGSYAGFQSAGTAGISFIDYHTAQNDLVFICNDNTCPAGTYKIGTITVKSGQSGTMTVKFVPKETADPLLATIAADGTSSSHSIASTAPASPAKKTNQNTFTVPKSSDDGASMVPLLVSGDELQAEIIKAQNLNEAAVATEKPTFWTKRNIIFAGVGVGIGFAGFLFLLLQIFGSTPPPTSGGSGPIITGGTGISLN